MSLLEINSAVMAFVMKRPAKKIKSHSLRVEKEDCVCICYQKTLNKMYYSAETKNPEDVLLHLNEIIIIFDKKKR